MKSIAHFGKAVLSTLSRRALFFSGLLISLTSIFIVSCRREIDIPVPAIYLTADEAFTALGVATGGKRYDANSAAQVPQIIIKVIQDNAGGSGADIVFLIDNTESMSDDIDQVKGALNQIISKLPASARIGAATYADNNNNPTNWYNLVNLSSDFTPIVDFINKIRVSGGGDPPESVYDGIYETVTRVKWSQPKRLVIVIGDAPPLNNELTKHSFEDVAKKCKEAGIQANLYPILID